VFCRLHISHHCLSRLRNYSTRHTVPLSTAPSVYLVSSRGHLENSSLSRHKTNTDFRFRYLQHSAMFRFPLLFLSLCFLQLVFAVDPVVDLGYAKYRGVHNGKDVVRWAGMRYARSVSRVDGMRFSPPQDPVPEPSGQIVNASDVGIHVLRFGRLLKCF
jgi:hypothetical protein